jgi:RimJ/RimL family protein N-acetyltransferase
VTFERTRDFATVKAIITHPQIWPHVGEDSAPPAADFMPVEDESVWYILVRDGAELLGLFVFAAVRSTCWEVHTCLLPNAWGPRAIAASREVAEWIWANTPCRRIVTCVPGYNRLALRLAKRAGLRAYGRNPKSYVKAGIAHDEILLGLSKPEE